MNSSSAWIALSAGTVAVGISLAPARTSQTAAYAPANRTATAPGTADDHLMREGMLAWRKSGRIEHAACADCHGPDGLEIALYDFGDDDIRRRAVAHLEAPDVDRIVGLIHAVRAKYGIRHLLDPLKDRPFQPGGEVLPGETPEARDVAFGRELQRRMPHLASGRVENLAQAKAAADEVMAVDPWTLKIGIPFNRFSEDVFHGKEHASLAHWIPDVSRTIPEDKKAAWYGLQDEYLANPTDDNLWKMYNAFDTMTQPSSNQAIAAIAGDKYRSLLLMQHIARHHQLGDAAQPGPVAFGALKTPMVPSPMWSVADVARLFQYGSPGSMGIDPQLAVKKTGGPPFQRQMVDLQASWFWLGWLFDQGLHRTSFRPMIARGDWMAVALWNAGPYPIHNAYWIARKQLVTNRVPEAWAGMPGRKRPEWDYLAMRIGGGYELNMPKDPVHRALYEQITSNCFRMSLFLMLDEWRTTKMVWYTNSTRSQVRALTDFIAKNDPSSEAQAYTLRDQCYEAIAACTQKT